MEKVNWSRVVLGGLIAGVVLIVLTSIATAFFIGQQKLLAVLLTLSVSTGGRAALLFVVLAFLFLGVLMTALHAAIMPRFGSGPKTAALAGFTVWMIGVSLSVVGFAVKNLVMDEAYPLPSGPMLPCICLGFLIASTFAGALVYKEQQS